MAGKRTFPDLAGADDRDDARICKRRSDSLLQKTAAKIPKIGNHTAKYWHFSSRASGIRAAAAFAQASLLRESCLWPRGKPEKRE